MIKLSASKAGDHQDQMDHFDFINTCLRNMCHSAPGIVIGSSANTKVKIGATTVFTSSGAFKSKASAEVAFTPTTHDIAPDAVLVKEAIYLLSLASDGTPTLTMGDIASGSGAAKFPERPATGTPIGAVRIAVAAGATLFDASSDALTAAHLTVTYYDLGYYAARFDVAL